MEVEGEAKQGEACDKKTRREAERERERRMLRVFLSQM